MKMAFKEVSSLDADVTVALGKKDKQGKPYPKQAEGYYLGSREVASSTGPSKLHFLQTPKGNLGIWGTTDLNRKLGSTEPGTMVRITSTGTKKTPRGEMYTYKVEQDSDNTIPILSSGNNGGGVEEGLDSASNSSYDDYSSDDDGEENDDVEEVMQVPSAAMAASSAADRAAKVQALLSKNKRK